MSSRRPGASVCRLKTYQGHILSLRIPVCPTPIHPAKPNANVTSRGGTEPACSLHPLNGLSPHHVTQVSFPQTSAHSSRVPHGPELPEAGGQTCCSQRGPRRLAYSHPTSSRPAAPDAPRLPVPARQGTSPGTNHAGHRGQPYVSASQGPGARLGLGRHGPDLRHLLRGGAASHQVRG